MGKLIYSTISSVDGYVADDDGNFGWAEPDEEVHKFINVLERPVGTYLYGRRMYEVMVAWENPKILKGQPPHIHEYARIWQAAEKIVYSGTLERANSARTRIEKTFDPEAVRQMKARSERDLSLGGTGLALHAIRAGLVDEYRLFLAPVVVGGGTRALPDNVRIRLELLAERRFAGGFVFLWYRSTA